MLIDFHFDRIASVVEITTEISYDKEVDLPRSSKVPTIMFGNGPVLDGETRTRTDHVHTLPGKEDIPFWSNNLAKAASILYKHNAAEEFFVMGGRTGGPDYASESEIIREKMKDLEIPSDIIRIEDQSYDTPTNLVHFLNEYTSKDAPIAEPTVDILGISSHLHRIRVFAKLFALQVRNAFAAEEVMRYQARKNPQGELDSTQWNDKELQKIEDMLNMKSPSSFFANQQGIEQQEYGERAFLDNLWVREALTYPERMPKVIAEIENDARMYEMVRIQFAVHGEEAMTSLGINLTDNPDKLRAGLRNVNWPILSPEEKQKTVAQWKKENISSGWPEELLEKYKRLMNYTPTTTSNI